jgi:hypothetical protein
MRLGRIGNSCRRLGPSLRIRTHETGDQDVYRHEPFPREESEEAFEKVWLSRDSHLANVPGFVEFRLLKARGFYALCLPLGLAEQGDV